MRTWTPKPPNPGCHVTRIDKPDLSVLLEPIGLHGSVCRATLTSDGGFERERPSPNSNWVIGGSSRYLITFSDGIVAVANYAVVQHILGYCGQELMK